METHGCEDPLVPNSPESEVRIVLLGRIGDGRSSSGNTILSKTTPFKSKVSLFAVTEKCQKKTESIGGQNVVVVDTPGMFNPKKKQEEVMKEIKKSISLAEPGPHVFLIVLNVEDTFTEELQNMVELIRSTFGKNTMAFTLVLFTHGDTLQKTIENVIHSDPNLLDLIIQCQWNYHVFNNKEESRVEVSDQVFNNKDESCVEVSDQVKSLLQKINSMIQTRGGGYYTKDLLEGAEKAVKEQQEQQQQLQRGDLHHGSRPWLLRL
ncbi:GTPase IMAP family member 9-like [Siniperca chuatsi]|uniref:GTPase IMAP family member 9-like n=1 Tax=Siniperca chuatsi TaxID=119488 RepID=UPI001CE111E2|nr:GTPase IMAP family member 9-like [Siniperca chuatsi]